MENFTNFYSQDQIEVIEQVDPAVGPDDQVIIGYGQLYDMCVAVSFFCLSVFGKIYRWEIVIHLCECFCIKWVNFFPKYSATNFYKTNFLTYSLQQMCAIVSKHAMSLLKIDKDLNMNFERQCLV